MKHDVNNHFRIVSNLYEKVKTFKHVSSLLRRLHNEEVHSLYHSPNKVRVMKHRRLRWADHVARMEEGRSSFKILTGTPSGKRRLGRPRRRWEDDIRMDDLHWIKKSSATMYTRYISGDGMTIPCAILEGI